MENKKNLNNINNKELLALVDEFNSGKGDENFVYTNVGGTGGGRLKAVNAVSGGNQIPVTIRFVNGRLEVSDETKTRIGWISFSGDSVFATYLKMAAKINVTVSAEDIIPLIGERTINAFLVRNLQPLIEAKIPVSELVNLDNKTAENVVTVNNTVKNQSNTTIKKENTYENLLNKISEQNRANVMARIRYIESACKFPKKIKESVISMFVDWFVDHPGVDEFHPCYFGNGGDYVEQGIIHVLMRESMNLIGPKGTGKNTYFYHIARLFGCKTCDPTASRNLCEADILGSKTFENGEVKYKPSRILEAASQGFYMICFDELNMARPAVLSILNSFLDFRRSCDIPDYKHFECHPKTIFFATMNVGDEYSGTQDMNGALSDRLHEIRFKPNADAMVEVFKNNCNLNVEDAEELNKYYKLCFDAVYCKDSEIPEEYLSQRKFIRAGKMFSMGFAETIYAAVEAEYVSNISDPDIKATIENLMLMMSV